ESVTQMRPSAPPRGIAPRRGSGGGGDLAQLATLDGGPGLGTGAGPEAIGERLGLLGGLPDGQGEAASLIVAGQPCAGPEAWHRLDRGDQLVAQGVESGLRVDARDVY